MAPASSKKGKKNTRRSGCSFLHFWLAWFPHKFKPLLRCFPGDEFSKKNYKSQIKTNAEVVDFSAGRNRPFPPHCCRGMRPENYLVVQVEEKRSPSVRRGGVCIENRHFIHHHVDQLFLTLKPPRHNSPHHKTQWNDRGHFKANGAWRYGDFSNQYIG